MERPVILVTNDSLLSTIKKTTLEVDADADLHILTGREGVTDALDRLVTPESLLVCFSTGVIVPASVLDRLVHPGYNFHAASPDYPGRDAHHFAVYEGAKRYGATAHKLVASVDAGQIVGVEWFDVAPNTNPEELRGMGVGAALQLYRSLMPRMMREVELPDIGIAWGQRKRSRRDFHAMCRLDPTIDRTEFDHRYFSFDGGAYDNLFLVLHGRCFRIFKPAVADARPAERNFHHIEPMIGRATLEARCRAMEAGEFDSLVVMLHGQPFRLESDRIPLPSSHRYDRKLTAPTNR